MGVTHRVIDIKVANDVRGYQTRGLAVFTEDEASNRDEVLIVEVVVGVWEGYPFTRGLCDSAVTRCTNALVFLANQAHLKRHRSRPSLYNLSAVIWGPVVDKNEFE